MRETRAAAVFAAVFLFIAVDLALFVALGTLARAAGFVFFQWIALLSVVCATAFSIRVMEGGRWNLGLVVSAPLASGELLRGMLFAAVLIVAADAMVLLSTPTRHARGGVFPWFELGMIFLPAALHEELAFRGYLYQKLRSWNRIAAIVITAALFAALSPFAFSSSLSGSSGLATSGRDRRRWRRGGRELHHLIDPRTGEPAESDLVRVTVVSGDAVEAEVAAKALFLAGAEDAAAEADAESIPAVLVTEDGRTVLAGGLA